MTAAKRNRWDQFYGFLQTAEGEPSTAHLKRDLETMGLDVARVDLAVSDIVSRSRSRVREGWLERARKAQGDFERSLRRKRDWVSGEYGNARDMIAAISSGRLGAGVQRQALVFFRNGKDLSRASDADLKSFLDDCEMLGLIDHRERKETPKE